MTYKRLHGECCRGPWCVHYPRQTGGDPLTEAAKRTASTLERHVTEAERQEEIRQALLLAGWRCWRVGQRDARKTQDSGVPDMIAIHPRHGLLLVECKRPYGGVLSRAQLEFREACAEAGVAYVVASQVADFEDWLADMRGARDRAKARIT